MLLIDLRIEGIDGSFSKFDSSHKRDVYTSLEMESMLLIFSPTRELVMGISPYIRALF
jgi:hypothetical protein